MPQNKEASQFLSRIASLPEGPVSLDKVLQPSLDDEAELRKLFATDKNNVRLKDIHVGLVDVFAASNDIRTTRARVIRDNADRDAQHIMSLPDSLRRKEGSPAMVESLEAFKKNWGIFTENSLSQLSLDWSNVVAAGGSVQACLVPLPKTATASKMAIRKYYHDKAFPSSDIDLFLYGLTAGEVGYILSSDIFLADIYVGRPSARSLPFMRLFAIPFLGMLPASEQSIRFQFIVSGIWYSQEAVLIEFLAQYPYRSVQIVLRLYSSPAEVLAGFDVDAPCCAYDGDRVWASPRAIVSMMRQSNTVDMTRRSPSYEVRLAKYASRGFEVYIPGLNRGEIDPTVGCSHLFRFCPTDIPTKIYERAVGRVQGLARLLAIEKLATPAARSQYQQRRSVLRGRPTQDNGHMIYTRGERRYNGDIKADAVFSGLELSDYDIVNLHIPYGPGWSARRIEKLIYKTVRSRLVLINSLLITISQDFGANCKLFDSSCLTHDECVTQFLITPRTKIAASIGTLRFSALYRSV